LSDKIKILLVGLALLVAAVIITALLFFSGKEKSATSPEPTGNGTTTSVSEGTYTRKGTITSISVERTDITVLSEDGGHSFSVFSAAVTDVNNNPINSTDLVVGMDVEAVVEKGYALSLHVTKNPPIAVISPTLNSVTNLAFNVEGIAYGKQGKACLELNNRRTGTVYETDLSADISSDGKFSIPIDLSSALDAMSGDMIDGKLSVCGEKENIPVSWGYYSGLTSRIKVYFLKDSCSTSYYVERVILASRSPVRAAIEEMLKGPNAKETKTGIFSVAKPTERIRSINVSADAVYIDFYSSITSVVRCSPSALRTQIVRTLSQFPTENVVITIEGEKNNPLN